MSHTSEIADAIGEIVAADSVTAEYSSTVGGSTLFSFTARRNRGEQRTDEMQPGGYIQDAELMLTATASALGSNTPVVNGVLTVSGTAYRITALRQDAAAWFFRGANTK